MLQYRRIIHYLHFCLLIWRKANYLGHISCSALLFLSICSVSLPRAPPDCLAGVSGHLQEHCNRKKRDKRDDVNANALHWFIVVEPHFGKPIWIPPEVMLYLNSFDPMVSDWTYMLRSMGATHTSDLVRKRSDFFQTFMRACMLLKFFNLWTSVILLLCFWRDWSWEKDKTKYRNSLQNVLEITFWAYPTSCIVQTLTLYTKSYSMKVLETINLFLSFAPGLMPFFVFCSTCLPAKWTVLYITVFCMLSLSV